MKLSFTTYRIYLKHPFGISRSSNNWYDIVLLFLQDGDIIVGLSSTGKASYEKEFNSGIGSNGLTSARHDILSEIYKKKNFL